MKKSRKRLLIIFALLVIILIGMDMYNSQKKIWFEGSNEITCDIKQVENALQNLGGYFVGTIKEMPSMLSVELIEQGDDFVTIQTNEGIMKRTNISKKVAGDRITVAYDEEYQAGKALTTHSHFLDEFEVSNNNVSYRITISNLKAPGFMGFFYRNFGSSNMGKAFLAANKAFLEKGMKKN
jgi:hypothetical protein